MDLEKTLADFNARIEAYQNLKQGIVEDLKKDFPSFVESVLREVDFPYLEIQGYTPSFNDGEPCEFGLHMDLDSGFDGLDKLMDIVGSDVDLSNLKIFTYTYFQENPEARRRARQIEKIFCNLEDILKDALDGNFEILAAIDADNKFHIYINTDYDCGY